MIYPFDIFFVLPFHYRSSLLTGFVLRENCVGEWKLLFGVENLEASSYLFLVSAIELI
jgi:hypothetical protein